MKLPRPQHQFDGGAGEAAALRAERDQSQNPMATTLTHESPMPFGQYAAKPGKPALKLSQVPADYLLWLWDVGPGGNALYKQQGGLADYIRANFRELEHNAPDTLVRNRPDRKR